MKQLSRIVWSEGMYLGPHHFQVQSRYFEDSIHFAMSSLSYAPFGFSGYELDAESLRNGTLSLLHARGLFPDGLVFQMPDCDALPAARNIAELFSPIRESVTALLAVAPQRPGAVNCSEDGGPPDARYVAETQVFGDENTGRDDKPVRTGRKNIRLLLDSESTEDLVTMPLARIKRDGSGHFIFDPDFIPPCLDIQASEPLMLMLKRLIGILEEKSSSLTGGKSGGPGTQSGWSAQEVANFWFLHSVNAALAPLRHLCLAKRGHPEQLFIEMSRLAGALCTFGVDSHPRTLPVYDHLHLEECFAALDQHIRLHLETIIPTNCISIPLAPAGDSFWSGKIADQRCLGRARWIFAIQSPVGEADLIEAAPRLVKVCSMAFVPKLVARALPGMALTHLQLPPPAVSPRLETQYFGISRAGPCWDHIVQTREVGVYVPGEIPSPQVELLVVLES